MLTGWLRGLPVAWQRRWRAQQLQHSVVLHLDVLPVASAQLREVSRQVEQAVSQVGGNFEKMVESARQGVNEASRLVGAAGESRNASLGIGAILSNSRTTLEDLLARIVRDSDVCANLVTQMDSLKTDMGRIVGALADVDRISFGNTILALNAKIEAAHLGEYGQSFELVAEEISFQAARSETITDGIRATIARLAEDVRAALRNIGEMACADHASIFALQHQTRKALDDLEQTHRAMQQSLSESGERNEALAASIVGAVQSLQFQDRVSQQIEHIVGALESMQESMVTSLDGLSGHAGNDISQSVAADRLARSYTTDGERSVHVAVLGGTGSFGEGAPSEQQDLSDIELF
jgi:methyl-accepting chemotaxis protein